MKRFIIHKQDAIRRENARAYIDGLDPNRKWLIEIKQYRKKRSLDQNAFLHAVPMKIICDHTGNDREDMREYLCGEFSGWQKYSVMGRDKLKPMMMTSDMDTKQFTDFLAFIQRWAMEILDLRIPDPNEWEGEY